MPVLLPFIAAKLGDLHARQFLPVVDAVQVDAQPAGVRSRDVERLDAAHPAERVARRAGAERVHRVLLAHLLAHARYVLEGAAIAQEFHVAQLDVQMKVSALRADAAVASEYLQLAFIVIIINIW